MLGAIKGVPAVLSGEMRDTVQLNPVAIYGLEKFFGREDRAEISNTAHPSNFPTTNFHQCEPCPAFPACSRKAATQSGGT